MFQTIKSDKAPKAIGPYSPAVKLGDFVYMSGQLPVDPQTGQLVSDDISEQTKQVFKNIEAVLAEMNLETRHIVKTTVFITDMAQFTKVNEVYAEYFDEPYPARSTIQVAALPLEAKVEIECLVIDTLAYEAQAKQHGSGCDDCDCGEDSCCG
ncbi:MAG: RidA family protein [Erysipelotrichaceae bacterium]